MSTTNASSYQYRALKDDFYFINFRTMLHELLHHQAHNEKMTERPSKRIRDPFDVIAETEPAGKEWIIERWSKSRFAFRLLEINRIVPNPQFAAIKILDTTSEDISECNLSDERILLNKIRCINLLDQFLGVATYSMNTHVATSIAKLGQVEIDELYGAYGRRNQHFIIPLQVKGGSNRLSSLQTKQILAFCLNKFPQLICRPVSAQFISDNIIAMFELALIDSEIRIVEEKHYRLVTEKEIAQTDLDLYRSAGE